MDETTIQRLNALNQAFYRTVGAEFDQTRGRPWPGWLRVWEHGAAMIPHGAAAYRVLDVGCGNGRLGAFLADQLRGKGITLAYHGLDSDAGLLARAADTLGADPAITLRLEERDILTHPPEAGQYDLVALFGVLHHVPGDAQRRDLLRDLAARVAPGGLLAFAAWRFYEYRRFRDRLTPWPDDLAAQVEAGDYLLDWRRGAHALRYCHYVDDAEHAALIAASGLEVVETFRADGRSGDANCYSVLRRPG